MVFSSFGRLESAVIGASLAHWRRRLVVVCGKSRSHWRSALPRYINQAWLARVGVTCVLSLRRRERSVQSGVLWRGADLRESGRVSSGVFGSRCRSGDGIDAAVKLMDRAGFDPSKIAVVEGVSGNRREAASCQWRVSQHGARHLRRGVGRGSRRRRVLLGVNRCILPGMGCVVDGQTVPIYATDLAFRGIFVPAGVHDVEFVYRLCRSSLAL